MLPSASLSVLVDVLLDNGDDAATAVIEEEEAAADTAAVAAPTRDSSFIEAIVFRKENYLVT